MMNVAISEEPPDEMNGSGLPVVGKRPTTQPMFKNAWNTSIMVQLPATMVPNAVDAALAMRMPEYNSAMNSIVPGVQEQHAVGAVARSHDGEHDKDSAKQKDAGNEPQGNLSQPHNGKHAHGDDDGGAQVRLRHVEERHGDTDEQKRLDQHLCDGAGSFAVFAEQARSHKDEHDLGKFRRLETDGTKAQPSLRTKTHQTHKRHEKKKRNRNKPDDPQKRATPYLARKPFPHHKRRHSAHDHEEELVGEVAESGGFRFDRLSDGRGVDHDAADCRQNDDRKQKHEPRRHDVGRNSACAM